MLKKSFIIIAVIFLLSYSQSSYSKINIVAKIDENIITNYDIEKELGYLKILNYQINQLDNDLALRLSYEGLVNEIIKKQEVKKFKAFQNIDFSNNDLVKNSTNLYLKDLLKKLNLDSIESLKFQLALNNSYTIDELRKKIQIEVLWNELIVVRFKNQLDIDEDKILDRINKTINKTEKEFLLNEIVFSINKSKNFKEYSDLINKSIKEIGFGNTANIYSISESAKMGGKIGWVSNNSLSDELSLLINNMKKDEHSNPIKIGNNYLILKVKDIRTKSTKLDKQVEYDKAINAETIKQLNKFSRIYFDKAKKNYNISEY